MIKLDPNNTNICKDKWLYKGSKTTCKSLKNPKKQTFKATSMATTSWRPVVQAKLCKKIIRINWCLTVRSTATTTRAEAWTFLIKVDQVPNKCPTSKWAKCNKEAICNKGSSGGVRIHRHCLHWLASSKTSNKSNTNNTNKCSRISSSTFHLSSNSRCNTSSSRVSIWGSLKSRVLKGLTPSTPSSPPTTSKDPRMIIHNPIRVIKIRGSNLKDPKTK